MKTKESVSYSTAGVIWKSTFACKRDVDGADVSLAAVGSADLGFVVVAGQTPGILGMVVEVVVAMLDHQPVRSKFRKL